MKEIKAYVHRARAADVVQALVRADFGPLSIVDVKGMLAAFDIQEVEYSTALGTRVISEIKIEFVCQPNRIDEALTLLEDQASMGHGESGVAYVFDVERSVQF
jgi:nitrogen regulatory protein P-II 1